MNRRIPSIFFFIYSWWFMLSWHICLLRLPGVQPQQWFITEIHGFASIGILIHRLPVFESDWLNQLVIPIPNLKQGPVDPPRSRGIQCILTLLFIYCKKDNRNVNINFLIFREHFILVRVMMYPKAMLKAEVEIHSGHQSPIHLPSIGRKPELRGVKIHKTWLIP